MVDLHSHILPGVDDGSETPEMSRGMLELLYTQGVRTVVATPHFYAANDTPEAFLRRRADAIQALEQAEMPGSIPQMITGAEVAYFDGMCRTEVLTQLQIGQTGLLLVEMPFAAWSQRVIREICQLTELTGLTPVLAHVDRYRRPDQLPKYQAELLSHGILFQCNAEAFLPRWDRRWALQMLRQGNIHFIGSDAHNLTTRKPQMDQAFQVITQKLGEEMLEQLMAFSKEMLNA